MKRGRDEEERRRDEERKRGRDEKGKISHSCHAWIDVCLLCETKEVSACLLGLDVGDLGEHRTGDRSQNDQRSSLSSSCSSSSSSCLRMGEHQT